MSWIAIAAGAAFIIGAILAMIGLRGRRIDEHPVCRKCRFDLEGVYPAKATCPECGRDLSRDRAVRTGNRRKRRGVLAVGGGMFAVALVIAAIVATVLIGGSNLNPYKPVWMLRLEAQGSDVMVAADAIDELMERYDDGDLSESQVDRLVTLTLDGHADSALETVVDWIAPIQSLIGGGELSDDEIARYVRQAVRVVVEARSIVRVGDPIAMEAIMAPPRFGGPDLLITGRVEELRVGGMATEPGFIDVRGAIQLGGRQAWLSLQNPAVHAPDGISTGSAALTGVLRLRIREGVGRSEVKGSAYRAHVEKRISLPIKFIDRDTVRLVTPSEEQRAAMAPTAAQIHVQPSQPYAMIVLSSRNATMGAASRAFLRADDEEFDTGLLYLQDPSKDPRESYRFVGDPMEKGLLDGLSTVDLILRPDPDAARQTTRLFEIYGEEIAIENVPIVRRGG